MTKRLLRCRARAQGFIYIRDSCPNPGSGWPAVIGIVGKGILRNGKQSRTRMSHKAVRILSPDGEVSLSRANEMDPSDQKRFESYWITISRIETSAVSSAAPSARRLTKKMMRETMSLESLLKVIRSCNCLSRFKNGDHQQRQLR